MTALADAGASRRNATLSQPEESGIEQRIRIGISGWTYGPWRGVFYPSKLPASRELQFASRQFNAIEVNGTFYRLQRPGNFERWYEQSPEDFRFAVKGSRYITHMLKAREVRGALANFFASGVLRLGHKLGPLLWQFPANVRFEAERFDAFLSLLPKTTEEALALARHHDARVRGRCDLRRVPCRPLRHALEIRHESFCQGPFIELLREHGAALVCADTVEWPLRMDLTADFVYCRLHGSRELYVSGYGRQALQRWAERVRAWAAGEEPLDAQRVLGPTRPRAGGREVYVFFDNDKKVRAPADARTLAACVRRLGSGSRRRPAHGS